MNTVLIVAHIIEFIALHFLNGNFTNIKTFCSEFRKKVFSFSRQILTF